MTFGSVFSGAGGFDLGVERAGLSCEWQCEIDPQASGVIARHWPGVKRFSDIRGIRKRDIGPVDVLVGGFPCQDLSVAGKRKGLSGERSGLFYELLRVARLCRPQLVVWENVPGLLSSDDGRDFGRVLRGLADIGYFGAWRVLDAKFFGVPQRRRRVFGVFARGRAGAGRAAEILALTAGVPGHSQEGGEAGEDVAFTLTSSVGRNSGGTRVGNAWNTNYVAARCQTSRGYRTDGESDNFVPVSFNWQAAGNQTTLGASEDGTGTISGSTVPAVAYLLNTTNRANGGAEVDTAGTADTGGLSPTTNQDGMVAVSPAGVRRLTPLEYERLMSWPDDHTRWDADGREFADGPRYRMAGNGVVANVAEWIARRFQ